MNFITATQAYVVMFSHLHAVLYYVWSGKIAALETRRHHPHTLPTPHSHTYPFSLSILTPSAAPYLFFLPLSISQKSHLIKRNKMKELLLPQKKERNFGQRSRRFVTRKVKKERCWNFSSNHPLPLYYYHTHPTFTDNEFYWEHCVHGRGGISCY